MTNERPDQACERYIGLLVRAADGALGETEQSQLDAHLASCSGCAEAVQSQRVARAALSSWVPMPVSPEFAARVLSRLDEQRSWFDRWDFRRWTWRLAPLASGFAIAALLVVSRPDLASATLDETMSVGDDTVAASLGSPELSQTDVLALLLTADADEPLVGALEELSQ